MTEDRHHATSEAHASSDVDERPVGGAPPNDTSVAAPLSTDLDELAPLDGPGATGTPVREDAPSDADPSIHERQDPDHVGVDWDLTARTRD